MLNTWLSILADSSSEAASSGGSSFGLKGIVGILLCLLGVGAIYVGIKFYNGMKIDFSTSDNIPQEDTHVPTTAKIQNKVKTTIPDFSGNGEKEIIEWTMVYEVDGEKYKQTIPDNGYEKGQIIDIKYEPSDPNDYYLYDKQAEQAKLLAEQNGETEEEAPEKDKRGLAAVALGLIFIGIGIMLIIG